MLPQDLRLFNRLDRNHVDGVLALQVLLSQKMNVSIYQRQILIARTPDADELVFVHGIPDTMNLTSAVTVQHKRMRRALLERAGVRIPKGANFSIGHGITQAYEYADKLGYPVVVKPSKGDVGTYSFLNVTSRAELEQAIDSMKVPVHERAGVYRASYTPMELGEPGNEDGRPTVTSSYRFLVEQRKRGDLIRFLVMDNEIIAASRMTGSPTDGTLAATEDMIDAVPNYLRDAVIKASNAIPHLAVSSIDVVYSRPKLFNRRRNYSVVDFAERPMLWAQAFSSPEKALELGRTIAHHYFSARGIEFLDAEPSTRVSFEIQALPSASASRDALPDIAKAYDVEFAFSQVDDLQGTIQGSFTGSTLGVAALLNDLTNDLFPEVPAIAIELFAAR